MRPALVVAVGALLLSGALLVTAPAALLDARVAALSGARVRVADATGTIWNGSGELVFSPAGTRQPLRWHIEFWPLFQGRIQGALATEVEGAPSASFAFGRERLELHGLKLALPARSVLALVAPAKLALGGTVQARIDHLRWQGNALDAQLALQWRDASIPAPRADARVALGDVRVDLDGRGGELAGPVRNSGGEVEISGQLGLAASGAARVDLKLRPRAVERERADLLAATLAPLGAADADGGYALRWSGAWR